MRKNYFAKLVKYMKNIYDIENGLNKLAGDYSSTLFLEGFTTITVNGARAYKMENILQGQLMNLATLFQMI